MQDNSLVRDLLERHGMVARLEKLFEAVTTENVLEIEPGVKRHEDVLGLLLVAKLGDAVVTCSVMLAEGRVVSERDGQVSCRNGDVPGGLRRAFLVGQGLLFGLRG